MPLLLVISNHGFIGRIVAHEDSIAVGPAAIGRDRLHGWTRIDKRSRFRQQVWSERSQRRDVVNYPDTATVGRDHEILVARMNCEIAHGHVRKISAGVLRPLSATIER